MSATSGLHDDEIRSPMSAYAKAGIAAVAGLALGLFATHVATNGLYPFGGVATSAWRIWPKTGALDIDPYARAINARKAEVPLGNGEGLTFLARVDDAGRALDGACDYVVEGQTPAARFWTLTLFSPDGVLLRDAPGRQAVTSSDIVRRASGDIAVVVAPSARAGNWIASPRGRKFVLALNLYDTTASPTQAALEGLSLLSIKRGDCL